MASLKASCVIGPANKKRLLKSRLSIATGKSGQLFGRRQ